MSAYFTEDSKNTAIALGTTAVGALALYYLWDRYSADSKTWAERRENVKDSFVNAEHKVEKKFEQAKESITGAAHKAGERLSGSDKGKNVSEPAPQVLSERTTVTTSTTATPLPATTVSSATATTVLRADTAMLHDPNPIVNEPELKRVKERNPVIQEVVHPVEVEEIQPVIHREIRKVEVHQITQPIYEEFTAPVREITKENIPEHRPTVCEDSTKYSEEFERGLEVGSRVYGETKKTTVYKPAIVEEVIKTDIIEVIQPVIHRDTVEPVVVHTSQPIYEKVREQPVIVHEVRKPIILTHDDVEILEAAKGAEQLEILERFSEMQGKGPVADRTFDDSVVVSEPAVVVEPVVVETTQTVITETVLV